MRRKLREIAYARSGDKGDLVNIAVIGRNHAAYLFLQSFLTEERVLNYFQREGPSRVERYSLPSLFALNFVLHDTLDGGASYSLRLDNQGKTFATKLLEMEFDDEATKSDFKE